MNRLNVLYTCDDNYLSLTSISIASVVENNKNTDICFYIATEKDDSDNYKRLVSHYKDNKRVNFVYINPAKYDQLLKEKHLDQWGSDSFYVYWKLFVYDDLNVDKIWYLDSDVLCLKEIDYPQINKTIGAVLDSAHADFNKLAHIDEEYYLYNTGSLYVDVEQWKKNKCAERVIDYINNMKYRPILCDQDILAIALQDEIEVINPKYNYLVGYDYYGVHNSYEMYSLNSKPFYKEEEIERAKNDVVFYHCLGGVFGRPWEENNESPIRKEFVMYRELSAWPNYKKERNISLLFKIEKFLEILPDPIYNKIHNYAQKMYLRKISK